MLSSFIMWREPLSIPLLPIKSILAYGAIAAMFYGLAGSGRCATVSPLSARGYTALPTPQKVELGSTYFELTHAWRIEPGPGVKADDNVVQDLADQLRERFHLILNGAEHSPGVVQLAVAPGTVTAGSARDRNGAALNEQAYRLELRANRIRITGNTTTGLFYGVQTLLQLLKPENGKLMLPEGTIEDWPDLELRILYWDDAHHLEHLETLKAALRQASFYKINGFALKLEGHFQYRHAATVAEPYALSAAELQELTNYGLRYHVQLIPYLDAPAHDSFILKHPEYAALREYPQSNYEFCATNPETYRVFNGMADDLLQANQGGKYFVLSTDEPYYVGLANNEQCHEAQRAKQLGSPGKLLAEFITKTADYLHQRGRTVIFWGEYPLKPEDIAALPAYLVNGEVYGPQFDPVFRARGIRQMIYTYTEGEEPLFPQYYVLPAEERLHKATEERGRVEEMLEQASLHSLDDLSSVQPGAAQPNQADLMGLFLAGWADAGLHPETFWLGYVTGTAAGWHQKGANAPESMNNFYYLFYGRSATAMGTIYQLMSEQAQFWADSWETGPTAARTPLFGNSNTVFDPPRPAHDQFLPDLPVPSPELLHLGYNWHWENEQRLKLAGTFLARNEQLVDLLSANLQRVEFNRYNLEVYLSIAALYRQNLLMLQEMGHMAEALRQAETAAGQAQAEQAVAALDRALDLAAQIREQRNEALQDVTATWSKTWFPRMAEANGRRFLDQVDDVKDHPPGRTVDMSYLVYRELLLPLDQWADNTTAARNQYAVAHHLALRNFKLNWKEMGSAK